MSAGYGGIDVLQDISLTVRAGQVCAVLGPNGAGKSTALKVLSGQLAPTKGTASINGHSIAGVPTERLVRGGLCVIPEGRGVFPNLTVTENLKMGSFAGTSYADILEKSFQHFPRLAERRTQLAGKLSGGEQQMLSMARALAVNPSILLVDELSMGLAPKIVEELYEVLAGIARQGLTILVVEQFAAEVLKVADSGALLINGRITYHGAPDVVGDMISSAYLGGEHAAPPPSGSARLAVPSPPADMGANRGAPSACPHASIPVPASAGGNLAAALILRARDEGLPLPAAVVLMTPGPTSPSPATPTRSTWASTPSSPAAAGPFLLYSAGQDLSHPYLSPLNGDFTKGFPPAILTTGTRDMLLSDTVLLHRALRRAGVPGRAARHRGRRARRVHGHGAGRPGDPAGGPPLRRHPLGQGAAMTSDQRAAIGSRRAG